MAGGHGGIVRTAELRRAGLTRRSILRAVDDGQLVRVRVGWYADPSAPRYLVDAHRVGGPPACATVAAAAGLWMLDPPGLHVEVASNASRLRCGPGSVIHWVPPSECAPRSGQRLAVALRQLATCLSEPAAVATIDSALHAGRVRVEDLDSAHPALRRVLAQCDGSAESGTESIFRLRAAKLGFPFRAQVEIPGGRVDFLFGDRLVVEVDGEEFHSGRDAFIADRERDAWHSAIGYYVVRLTYAQVVHRWHEVESLLSLLHARGEQRSPIRMSAGRARSGAPRGGVPRSAS